MEIKIAKMAEIINNRLMSELGIDYEEAESLTTKILMDFIKFMTTEGLYL